MVLHRRYSIRGVLGLAQTGTALAPGGVGQFDSFWLPQPITLISYINTMSSKKDMRRADLGVWNNYYFKS